MDFWDEISQIIENFEKLLELFLGEILIREFNNGFAKCSLGLYSPSLRYILRNSISIEAICIFFLESIITFFLTMSVNFLSSSRCD